LTDLVARELLADLDGCDWLLRLRQTNEKQ
jgi:hypothetical protein